MPAFFACCTSQSPLAASWVKGEVRYAWLASRKVELSDPSCPNVHVISSPASTFVPVSGSVTEPLRLTEVDDWATSDDWTFHSLDGEVVVATSASGRVETYWKAPVVGVTIPTAPAATCASRLQFPQYDGCVLRSIWVNPRFQLVFIGSPLLGEVGALRRLGPPSGAGPPHARAGSDAVSATAPRRADARRPRCGVGTGVPGCTTASRHRRCRVEPQDPGAPARWRPLRARVGRTRVPPGTRAPAARGTASAARRRDAPPAVLAATARTVRVGGAETSAAGHASAGSGPA